MEPRLAVVREDETPEGRERLRLRLDRKFQALWREQLDRPEMRAAMLEIYTTPVLVLGVGRR